MSLSTCLSLSGPEIIRAYAWRFKVEISFRTLHQILSAFDYHFWLKPLARAARVPRNLDLAACSEKLRAKILAKARAYERFVNLAGISLGLLQILALEQSSAILSLFPATSARSRPMASPASRSSDSPSSNAHRHFSMEATPACFSTNSSPRCGPGRPPLGGSPDRGRDPLPNPQVVVSPSSCSPPRSPDPCFVRRPTQRSPSRSRTAKQPTAREGSVRQAPVRTSKRQAW